MTLTTSSWERPIQGVSQQPPKVRLPGQSTLQENAISSVVSGLIRRPGTVRLASLFEESSALTRFHYYNRGDNERYIIAIEPNSLPRVFGLNGDEYTIENMLSDEDYVRVSNPDETLSFDTIGDFTFITNSSVIPKKSTNLTPSLNKAVIINVQFADYGRDYIIKVDGEQAARYSSPDGEDASQITQVDTGFVATALASGVNRDNGGVGPEDSGFHIDEGLLDIGGDFEVLLQGNTIILSRLDNGDFTVTTEDGADGRDLFAIKNSVKEVSDLPLYAPEGYKVEVVGSGASSADNYWLEAQSVEGDVVRWVESNGPEVSTGFDNTTMPHAIVRDRFENGQPVFQLIEVDWSDRETGDDNTNPFPSFIIDEFPITSLGTFQNRLYLTAGESVVMSRSNYFFEFFRDSVRTALDDDPIDIYADTRQVNYIKNSAVLDGDVAFFSANGQFLLPGREAVTKEKATLRYASTFENIDTCSPVASGDVIFFAFKYGRFSGIREFYTDSFTDTKKARPVTDHVDEYITGTARQLATSTNKNQLIVLGENPRELFLYSWLWQGQERVQSSWSKWIMKGDVRYVVYDKETLFIIISRDGTLEVETMELGDPDDPGLDFPVRLDRRVLLTATRDNGHWSFTMPYDVEPDQEVIAVRGEGCYDKGVTISFDRTGREITTLEDIAEPGESEVEVIVGIPFTTRYQPTMPFIKDRNGRVIDTDRLIINDVFINYDKTGDTRVIVENEWGNSRFYEFNGRRLGGVNNLIGFAPLIPGYFSFPIRQNSDRAIFTIETDSHLPFQLRDMEWRGRFNQRGRRV